MLLPEPKEKSTSVPSGGPTSNMPTRKKPRVIPSFTGLGLPAPASKLEAPKVSVAKSKAVTAKAKTTTKNTSKSPVTKSTKTSNRVTKAESQIVRAKNQLSDTKNSVAAKGKGKARASPAAPSQSVSENEQQTGSNTTAKGRSTRTKASQTEVPTDKKRKSKGDSENDPPAESSSRPTKRARVEKAKAPPKPKVVINHAPTERLDIYVCGEGSAGELGLGNAKGVTDVKRPRLNPHLKSNEVGVVHIAAGGMHAAALTHDNQVLTWGVNDQGALGRDTHYEGGLQNINKDDASDSTEDSDDIGLNPREVTPIAIPSDAFPDGTIFTQIAAGDSCTFALTDDGLVYGWGTFRVGHTWARILFYHFANRCQAHDGVMGFLGYKDVQRTPILVSGLKDITRIICGANHAMALDRLGKVFIWGCGEQAQLGFRPVERMKLNGLKPSALRIKGKVKMVGIGTGSNHAFSIDDKSNVWTWGSNSFGQTGINIGAGEDNAVIFSPEKVKSLGKGSDDDRVIEIAGGMHHSIAVTSAGKCLVWGRVDGCQTGLDMSKLSEEDYIVDARNNPRILTKPTVLEKIQNAQYAAAGTDHNIALDGKHEAYAWGFSANYQTGLGTSDDVEEPTKIDNTATRGKKLTWAGAGGQYSMLAGPHVEA